MVTARPKSEGEPRKLRWTVPAVDVSVIEWLDTQYDVSQSLRALIRESIERDGIIDVFYKPVEKQPRRGRPPGSGSTDSSSDEDTVDRSGRAGNTDTDTVADTDTDTKMRSTPQDQSRPEVVSPKSPVAAHERAEKEREVPVEQVVPDRSDDRDESEPKVDNEPSSQASIDEIMASTRR